MWKTTVEPTRQNKGARVVPVVRLLGVASHSQANYRVFSGEEVPIGRAAGEDGLQFPDDERVSRRHALLRFDAGARSASIEDLSRTGTFVQGRKVLNETVREGEVVRVGDSFFLFRFEPEALVQEDPAEGGSELIGPSMALRTLRHSLSLVGRSGATVIILGESGTGKELAARALHEKSGRAGPFVAVNCGAIPEALVESQFFGHVAGAFTGAKADARGWFRAAEGGTLFLDEIGELPLLVQPKLLRAVEERAVVPVGATQPIAYDARIVAATNRDLSDRERFRADLFARISEFVLEIPPLRARREDILPILSRLLGPVQAELDAELIAALLLYDYPHNARDLRRIATQLAVRGAGQAVWDASLLDRALQGVTSRPPEGSSEPAPDDAAGELKNRVPTREELDTLLRVHRGVVAEIAKDTGRSRKQVYRWLAEHGLSLEDYRAG